MIKTLPPRYRKRRRSIYHYQQQQIYAILMKIVIYGTIISITCIIGYYSIRIVVIFTQSIIQNHQPGASTTDSLNSLQENHQHHRLFDLAYDDLNLWLDSTNEQMSIEPSIEHILRQHMIQSCLPNDNTIDCSTSTSTNTNERIGIIRSPGLLGRILEDYIQQFIHHTSTTTKDVDNTKDWVVIVQPNSNAIPDDDGNDWTSFTKIIRPVVMPILLDVLDLLIQTTGNDYPIDNVTMDDMINTLRILIQWHCYIAQMGTVTETAITESISNHQQYRDHYRPMLSISLHHFMSYPYEINESMIEFLQLEHYPIQQLNKDLQKQQLNGYAEIIFHRIDLCTSLLDQLRTKYTITKQSIATKSISSISFTDMLNDVIRNELNHGYCSKTDETFDIKKTKKYRKFHMDWNNDDRIKTSSSRVIEMIHTIFVENSLYNICVKYPQAFICTSK
jgi:hypothetical protein